MAHNATELARMFVQASNDGDCVSDFTLTLARAVLSGAQHERERIASIIEREIYETNSDASRSAAELAYRKGHNDRTGNIVSRLRDANRSDTLCS